MIHDSVEFSVHRVNFLIERECRWIKNLGKLWDFVFGIDTMVCGKEGLKRVLQSYENMYLEKLGILGWCWCIPYKTIGSKSKRGGSGIVDKVLQK